MLVKNSATCLICSTCHLVNDTGILFSSEENAEHLQAHISTHKFSGDSDYKIGRRSQKPLPSTFLNFIPDSWNCSWLQIFISCRPFNILKTSPLGRETRGEMLAEKRSDSIFSKHSVSTKGQEHAQF